MLSALVTLEMRLIRPEQSGMDNWGHAIVEEQTIDFNGYYYQFGTEDPDREGQVNVETGKVIGFFPKSVRPRRTDAIEFDVDGEPLRLQIIGNPEPKFSLARGKRLHHWEMLVSGAAA